MRSVGSGASSALARPRRRIPGGVRSGGEDGEGEILVPLAAEFCTRIDVKAKRIDVSLPDGLRN